MAIVQNPLINRTSGPVGNSIFSKWKRKNTLRSKPINPYPLPSPAQVAARTKFKNCSETFMQLSDYFPYFFPLASNNMSVVNFFVKQNLNLFTPDANIIYESSVPDLVICTGKLPAAYRPVWSFSPQGTITVSASYPLFSESEIDDCKQVVIIFNFTQKKFYAFLSLDSNLMEITIENPPFAVNDSLFVFTFFSNFNLKKSSNSLFITNIIYQKN